MPIVYLFVGSAITSPAASFVIIIDRRYNKRAPCSSHISWKLFFIKIWDLIWWWKEIITYFFEKELATKMYFSWHTQAFQECTSIVLKGPEWILRDGSTYKNKEKFKNGWSIWNGSGFRILMHACQNLNKLVVVAEMFHSKMTVFSQLARDNMLEWLRDVILSEWTLDKWTSRQTISNIEIWFSSCFNR